MSLPYAADAQQPLTQEELEVLKKQFESEGEHVSVQTKFNYSWGLIKSTSTREQRRGVKLLSEIFKDSPERRRECLYYLALGHYKLGNFNEARRFNDTLLEREPHNLQAQSLKGLIEGKLAREGVIGMAIVSGIVTVGAYMAYSFFQRKR